MTNKEKLTTMYEVKRLCDIMQIMLNESDFDEAEVYKRRINTIRTLMEELGFRIDVRFELNKETHKREPRFLYAEVGDKFIYMITFNSKNCEHNINMMYDHLSANNRTGYRCDYTKMKIDEAWN